MPGDNTLLDFINSVRDLIRKQEPRPSEGKVTELAERIGISAPNGEDVDERIHKIGQEALRDTEVRARFLKEIPEVFSDHDFVKKLEDLKKKYPDYSGEASGQTSAAEPRAQISQDGDEEVVGDVFHRIQSVSALRDKFQDVLFGVELPDHSNALDLHDQLLAALNGIRNNHDMLKSDSGDLPARVRALLSALTLIEDDIESCLDALSYFSVISDSIIEARKTALAAGITEADRTSAELIRLRELNHCREQVRYRLNRLHEDCGRIK